MSENGATSRYGPLRTTRLELVDGSGQVRAFLGTDKEQDTALVFLDDQKRERIVFGVWASSYTPKMLIEGRDGNDRVALYLSRVDDRPMILLGDHERTRVHGGFFENDAPGPKDEDWGIRFYEPHNQGTFATLGMRRDWNDDKMTGFVYVKGKDDQRWSQPGR